MIKLARMKIVCRFVLFVFIFNMMSGCGGGGGSTTTVQPVTVALDNPSTAYAQQQIATAKVANYVISDNTYQGTIDGTMPITLTKSATSSLIWLMPTLSDGNHTITLDLGGQKHTIQFIFKQVQLTQAPDTIINDTVFSASSNIDSELNNIVGQADQQNVSDSLIKMKNDLASLQNKLSSLTADEKIALSNFIQANIAGFATTNKLVGKTVGKTIPQLKIKLFLEFTTLIYSLSVISAPGLGTFFGTLGSVASFLAIREDLRQLKLASIDPNNYDVVDELKSSAYKVTSQKKAVSLSTGSLLFSSSMPQSFILTSTSTLKASSAADFADISEKITPLLGVLQPFLSQDIYDWIASRFAMASTSIVSSGNYYRLQSISDSNITGASTTSITGNLKISFSFKTLPPLSTMVPFTFTLIDSRDNHTSTFSATLTPATIDHVTITAPSTNVILNESLQLEATAYSSAAGDIVVPTNASDYAWSVTSGSGSVNASGLFTAGNSTGQATVVSTHRYTGITSSYQLSVVQGNPGITISSIPLLFNFDSHQVTIKEYDSSGNKMSTIASDYTWSDDCPLLDWIHVDSTGLVKTTAASGSSSPLITCSITARNKISNAVETASVKLMADTAIETNFAGTLALDNGMTFQFDVGQGIKTRLPPKTYKATLSYSSVPIGYAYLWMSPGYLNSGPGHANSSIYVDSAHALTHYNTPDTKTYLSLPASGSITFDFVVVDRFPFP